MKTLLSLVVVVCALGAVSGYPRLTRPQQHNRVQYDAAMMENKYGPENPESEEFELKIAAATISTYDRNSGGPSVNFDSEKDFELSREDLQFEESYEGDNEDNA